ncbi:unnamed protein product [Echinostoma caproni]|uniref:Uncharacterized protein n=1 Tax=Echinostoma caproni TaxID=27848 RepID=A0A183BES6_9TREM|nr:unnamed protein product [Echinostoma caproni]
MEFQAQWDKPKLGTELKVILVSMRYPPYERIIVDGHKDPDEELTIKTIYHTTVAREYISKVFDFERAFEAACEESAEWSNHGGVSGND